MNNTIIAFFFAILSFLCYSLWGLFNGIVSRQIEPFSGLFYSSIGYMISGVISLGFIGFQPQISGIALGSSLFLGLATGFGGLFLLLAIQKLGNTAILVALTATYPVATVILSYFLLKEVLSFKQMIGCLLSIIGVIFMLT